MASRNGSHNGNGACRVAMYSPGMVGFGHIRRNASIAQALRSSPLHPAVVMIAAKNDARKRKFDCRGASISADIGGGGI